MEKTKNEKGFTLVELLVVIAIIGILAVLAVPSLLSAIDKAKAGDIEADISAIRSTVLIEYAENSMANLLTTCGKDAQAYSKKDARENSKNIEDAMGQKGMKLSGLGDNAIYKIVGTSVDNTPKCTLTVIVPNEKIKDLLMQNLNNLAEEVDGTNNKITVELLEK